MEEMSEIKKSFKNETLFITGGTGFLGKVLIEKLLRACSDLNVIYILVRNRKNKTAEERFKVLFNKQCFDNLKTMMPNIYEKVSLMKGDCKEPGCGLSQLDLETLKKEVTIVIHAAANVSFNQSLKSAVASNVTPVKEILHISKQMPRLKALVFVSTAYANSPPQIVVKERFYDPPIKAEALFSLLEVVDDETLELITPQLFKGWVNSYAYTKSVAEDVIRVERGNLPIAVVRPGIIHASADEPVPGWTDFNQGIIAFTVGTIYGVIRTVYCKFNVDIHAIPCDFVANGILAVTWETSTRSDLNQEDIQIYNFTGSDKTLMTVRNLKETGDKCKWDFPFNDMVWFPTFNLTECKLWNRIQRFLFHTVVSYVVDFYLFCVGKKRIAVQKYRQLNLMLTATETYYTTQFYFDYENVERLWRRMNDADRKLFNINMDNFDWDKFWLSTGIAVRYFLLKDPPDTIPRAKRKILMFAVLHFTIIGIFWFLLFKFMLSLFISMIM